MSHVPHAREAIRALASSKIREVANAGMGRAGVLPFWFGEPDQVTPAFIRDAAISSLNAGETFYNPNLGIPELHSALAAYVARLHGSCDVDNIAVTNSGMYSRADALAAPEAAVPSLLDIAAADVWLGFSIMLEEEVARPH